MGAITYAVVWAIEISGAEVSPLMSYAIGVAVAAVVSVSSIRTVLQNIKSLVFDFSNRTVKLSNGKVINFDDITHTSFHIVAPKFVFGSSLYEVSFFYGRKASDKFTVVDSRLFFLPTLSGYSDKEVVTLLKFFNDNIFEGVDKQTVDALGERLVSKQKNPEQQVETHEN